MSETSEETKRCWKCEAYKPPSMFSVDKSRRDGRAGKCLSCNAKIAGGWKSTDHGKATMRVSSFRRLGVELSVDSALPPADHSCEICGRTDTGWARGWHLDHDHDSGAIRGWLCQPCNTGLGRFKDSPPTLAAAIRYLHAHGKALSTDDLASLLHLNTS